MKIRGILISVVSSLLLLCACDRGEMGYSYTDESTTGKVLIFYAPAANNLAPYITKNVNAMSGGLLPGSNSKKVILVYAHTSEGESYLRHISAGDMGSAVSDTLLTVEAGRSASEPEVVAAVLGKVLEEYPAENYSFSLILSSHGTGWIPANILNEDDNINIGWASVGAPRKKTFGNEKVNGVTYDINIPALAEAIPMKLDCMVFDACLMGGIEVAYQLRDKVVKLCCSPAEVPGNGYIYSNIGDDLLSDSATPEDFSRAFYEHYRDALETGIPSEDSYYGATSTTVDCSKLGDLAQICTGLFEKYRSQIAAVNPDEVQPFHRTDPMVNYYRDFFDLRDILLAAGISREEDVQLQRALEKCITYKAATRSFMKNYHGFDINTYCGLSMYLPCKGNAELDAFYKTLDWNIETKLVK